MGIRRRCSEFAGALVPTALALLVAIAVSEVHLPAARAAYPERAIEYVVQASAGGSSDRFVRQVVQFLKDFHLVSVPITVNNVAGGGGALAANYMKGKQGNPYYLLNTSGNFIVAPLRDPSVPGFKDFTAIARLAFDLNSVVVRSNSPYRTMSDLVNAAKARPGAISWAGTSIGSQDHLTVLLLQRVTGARFNFISFTGSNEVMAALLGGHVDVAAAEPWVAISQAEAGRVRILGLVADRRLPTMPSVPTLVEQGYDVVLPMQRGVVAPANISQEARRYLIGVFEKLSERAEWKQFLTQEGLLDAFLPGDEYANFLASETDKWAQLLREAGVIR